MGTDPLFKNQIYEAGAIIRNETALLPKKAPSGPLLREREINEIADAIRPLTNSRHGQNLFICGSSGNGKTATMEFVLSSLANQTSKVIPVYVNCGQYSTQMGIYSQIIETLELSIPRRGWAPDEVFARICEHIDQEGISILLVLDKVNRFLLRGEHELFNSIANANEEPKARFGLIGISSERQALGKLSTPLRMALGFSTIEFDEYTFEQLRAILDERAELALTAGSYSPEVMDVCARIGKANDGNALLALEILSKAARHAEQRKSKIIELSDVQAVHAGTDHAKITLENYCALFDVNGFKLSEHEKMALKIIAQKGEMPSSEFYDKFLAAHKVGKRQVRYYLASLGAKGLITSKIDRRDGILDGKKIQLKMRR